MLYVYILRLSFEISRHSENLYLVSRAFEHYLQIAPMPMPLLLMLPYHHHLRSTIDNCLFTETIFVTDREHPAEIIVSKQMTNTDRLATEEISRLERMYRKIDRSHLHKKYYSRPRVHLRLFATSEFLIFALVTSCALLCCLLILSPVT